MSMAFAWLGFCIFVAWTIEAMSGFGSIVIALSLGALLLPIPGMLPVLVTLNVFTSSWLAWQHRRHIDGRLLCRTILPAMLLGTALGMVLRDALPGPMLKLLFAGLILWFAGRELWLMRRGAPRSAHPALQTQALVGAAGVTHGLFASGGPLLVFALAGRQMDKARFRATLITVWLVLNGVLAAGFLWQGVTARYVQDLLLYLPVLVVAVWLGNRLHQGLDEQRFRRVVFLLLLVVGAALLVSQGELVREWVVSPLPLGEG